jgi:hypothetical protein
MVATNALLRAAAVIALTVTACGSVPHASTASTSSSTASLARTSPTETSYPTSTTASGARLSCPAVQTAPQFPPSAPSTRNLALVTLNGRTDFVVRDITDINNPRTVGTLNVPSGRSISTARFVSASDVAYIDDDGNLIRLAYASSARVTVTPCTVLFDWSPDGTAVVYAVTTDAWMTVHQLSAGHDQVLGSVLAIPIVGCELIASCYGADTWDVSLNYSPDGKYISLVDSIANTSTFRLWTPDGKLVKSSDTQSPFMSVWSGGSLYFRDTAGVEVWRAGVVSSFLPGVAWIRPKASPGGGQIIYDARDAQAWDHSYVVDTASGKVRDLGNAHEGPVFLTSRYVWYQGQRPCVDADYCGTRVAGVADGKTYVFDLQAGTESGSIITNVVDVWPHAA